MPNMNLLVSLNVYSDAKASNSPSLRNLYWSRDLSGLGIDNPGNQEFDLAALAAINFTNKKFVYIETKAPLQIAINGGTPFLLNPFIVGTAKLPGIFMLNGTVTSLDISNPSTTDAVTGAFVAWSE